VEPTDENIRAWEDAHKPRPGAPHQAGGLPPQVRAALGELHGKRVLHVGCGTGEATAELAELGATATGVDPSDRALDAARTRAPSVLWVHAELDTLPGELRRGRFDLVYASALGRDLGAWAGGIADGIAEGGDLLVFAPHPVARCVDGLLHWREGYFDPDAPRLGQIVTVLAGAGFRVRALEEYPAHGRRGETRVPAEFLLHAVQLG
jgi:SAM-dependent methyltransferase